jgi:predicted outer membrane repeat protein
MLLDLILLLHEKGTTLNFLKKSFVDVYGWSHNVTKIENRNYTNRPDLTLYENVYIYRCFFRDLSSESNGGAIYCSNSVTLILIEQSSFISCTTSNYCGGGIYFYNDIGGESFLNEVCSFNCSSTNTTQSYGSFAYLKPKDNPDFKNHANYTSSSHSLSSNNGACAVLDLSRGTVIITSSNITSNAISNRPAYACGPTLNSLRYTCYVSYCQILDNIASMGGTLKHWSKNTMQMVNQCNILNNSQTITHNTGTIISEEMILFIKDSCILGNNKEGIVFYSENKGEIILSNCTIDNDIISKTRYNTRFAINKTVETIFICEFSHIAAENCDSFFDSYKDFKLFSKTPTTATMHLSPTLEYTLDGEWAEIPGVIIKDDDIPVVHETHFPLQTNYYKTPVSSVTSAANISIGAIVIAVIIGISVYNFLRSGQKLKKLFKNGKYDVNVNSNEFLSHSSSYSSE